MLAAVPFLRVGLAPVSATTERSSRERSKVDAVELILRKLVDSGAVPGVSYSIGNRSETLAEGAFGLRVVEPRRLPEGRYALSALATASSGTVRC